MITELKWNVDGHRLLLNINKTELVVTPNICPHGNSSDAPCFHVGIESCAVNYFINTFGLETNHGVVAAAENVEIAWAMSGSPWDIDLVEFHMIPVTDAKFSDWMASVSK
jgi:hypothetical protein